MKKYKVTLSRCYATDFEVDAEDEEEALDKANEEFDGLSLSGTELYDDYQTNEVEELEENDEAEDE